jgi:hemimethylated DNA binding protein
MILLLILLETLTIALVPWYLSISLLRIRSTRSAQFFDHFDPATGMFVPNEILAYEYPKDTVEESSSSSTPVMASEDAALDIIAGVEDMGDHLRRIILDYTSSPESRKLTILAQFLNRMLKISSGDILPIKDRLAAGDVSKKKRAALYLQQLISLSEDVGELLWQRRRYLQSASSFDFSVGDIVKHKEYGFRGVIVASDPEPSVDVSRWDGLQHIKNPETYPFYHIIPDHGDCIDAFGAQRSSRYVCQANLEVCPLSERKIDVDLVPEWEFNSTKGLYSPPDDIKFKYGKDLGDDGLTKQCLMELRDALTKTLVAMRDSGPTGNAELDTVAKKLAVDNLMNVLRDSGDLDTSTTISDSLKEVWRAHTNGDLKDSLDTAIGALLGGKTERALALFTDLIDQDPNYAEAWNKASTCEFMLGNLDASLAAAQKTLEIIPTHFQAQNGLGLVYYEKKELPSAVDSFRKSLELDPWSPVSARLSLCLDTIEKWKRSPGPKVVE